MVPVRDARVVVDQVVDSVLIMSNGTLIDAMVEEMLTETNGTMIHVEDVVVIQDRGIVFALQAM